MFSAPEISTGDKVDFYSLLNQQSAALLHGEANAIANAANLSSLIFDAVADINWAGFYFYDGTELVLGPFMGKPACVRIEIGKGVCGTAAASLENQLIKDVHAFPGHIACDSASNSEVVIPLHANGNLVGVLDIDSPTVGRFDDIDRQGFEQLAVTWMKLSSLNSEGRVY